MRNTNGADKAKGNVCSKTLEKESPQQLKPEKPAPQRDTSFCFGRNGKVQKDENGKKWFNGVPVPEEQPGDAFLHGKKISKPKIFKYRSERLIADLLQHPVGMPLPAAPNYAVDWDQDFANSLLDTIEINPNDSDEVKNIKRDVIETKKDLVQRIKNGEKFSDVIDETQREANKIASKRNEMLRIYNEIKRDGATPQELKDHLDAANKLLEREGALPLPISRKLLIQLDEKINED